jgi:hypothetical protein
MNKYKLYHCQAGLHQWNWALPTVHLAGTGTTKKMFEVTIGKGSKKRKREA